MIRISLFLLVLTMPLSLRAIDSVVTFHELQYHPPGPSQAGEWLELHCEMARDVDLSGWRISGGIEYVFPEGTIVEGGGHVVVALNPNHATLAGVGALGPFIGQLSNGGEELNLRDKAGRLMDTLDYRDRGEWPVAADGSGTTLSKKQAGLRSSRSSSWAASLTQGGSPGQENFPAGLPVSDPDGPRLNEVAPAGSAEFFLELVNPGSAALDLSDFQLVVDGEETTIVPLPPGSLDPAGLLSLTAGDLGVTPMDGDRIFVLRALSQESPLDARRVTGSLRGRAPGHGEAWLYPESATPGAANLFDLESRVVINEISYNPPGSDPLPAMPPVIETTEVLPVDAVWRYNESGADLGANWATESHAVGDDWQSGPGVHAYDIGIPLPVGTFLNSPGSNFPKVVTYYFESDFDLTAEQAEGARELVLDYAIDDGAIFYLNGFEVERFQMPEGPVTSETLASAPTGEAAFGGPVVLGIPHGLAVAGTNRFSVELHQWSAGSNDVVFGLQASLNIETDPGRPRQPVQRSTNQWVELFNRGPGEVDLTGWHFGEGIDYEFPFGTTLAEGEYLVVAREPDTLGAAHPNARIVGPFSRALSRSGETLTLCDARKNPADSLRYHEGGKWPGLADGAGSTLELTDHRADNSLPGAWAASDELARTSWESFTIRGTAERSSVGPDSQWRDFVFGLLEEGEILIDDLSVIEDPDGAAVSFLVDGTFEGGNTDSWRFVGNHREAEVVPDPDGGGNVLRLRATGSTGHMHNHVETTLANGESVVNGREYEISFRARWLNGDNQLHTRLYFNRLPHTTRLQRPSIQGTPGAPNSTQVANAGPTSYELSHDPPVPGVGESVRVTLGLEDPDGIQAVTLFYRIDGGDFVERLMIRPDGDKWLALIPGNAAGRVVQFYVEATDSDGATSWTPAGGPESRAMFQVDDGRAADTGINNIRIIMDPNDENFLHERTNVMSNGRLPCTVIDREKTIYYDAGVRIKGSQRARLSSSRVGFNLGFPRDQLYRGVHRTIAIDRSEGQVVGQRELLFDLMATSSGGIPGEHNDLCYVIAPRSVHTSAATLQMARYGSDFLDSQFENGSEGTVYEYELIYYPTTADAQGYKYPQPDSVVGTNITSLGPDPEDYRWNYLIKNNQENDNFDPMLRMTSLFDLPRSEFQEQVDEVLDVDQWLRSLAYACAAGAGDSYFSNSRHNGQFYGRPDGKVLFFPHDNDFLFQTNRPIFQNTELSKLITDPAKKRRYLGHLEDICRSVYNRAWMARWTSHFDVLVPGSNVFSDDLGYIDQRSNYILSQVNQQVAPVAFGIETNNGEDFTTSDSPVVLEGKGWVNIDEIRLSGSSQPLPVVWTTDDDWEVSLAVGPGANLLVLEAYDFAGDLVGTDAITVTSTGSTVLPTLENLVVSEIFYNPGGSGEGAEYLEFMNVSPTRAVDLSGLQITDGVEFVFPGGTVLAPGQRVLVVSRIGEFEARFGGGLPVAGTFANQLANEGEILTIRRADGSLIRSFSYSDAPPWPTLADGEGFSLVLADPWSAPDHALAVNWRASAVPGGSPAMGGGLDYEAWKAGFGNPADDADPDGDGWTVFEEFILGGSPVAGDDLAPLHQFDRGTGLLTMTVNLRVGAGATAKPETSFNLEVWTPSPDAVFAGSERTMVNGVDVDQLRFTVPIGLGERYYRFRYSRTD